MPPWLRRSCIALACALVAVGCSGGGGGSSAGSNIPGVTIERAAGRSHREGTIDYSGKKPPSGGDHNPIPLTCGYYSAQPPDEYAVHSLEHGAVWLAFGPSTSASDVETLKQLAKHPKVLVTPYAGLDSPLVLVAWERRLEVPSVSDPRVQQFIDAFAGGPQAPERTAACAGVGQPAT
ncbi:MAG TPA: DUF3105 domain-containing protein [Acidimicrobiales bacterium]|jgi:hypothetical protein